MRKGILFPRGGGGNHLRWLLSLTDQCNYADIFNVDVENSVTGKLDFIGKEVYNSKRNQKNWLKHEYLHREKLDSFMQILHTHDWPVYDYDQLLILDFETEAQCLEYYLKLHPTLGGRPVQEYIDDFVCFRKSITGSDWREFYARVKEQSWPWYDSFEELCRSANSDIVREVREHGVDKYVHAVPNKYVVIEGNFLHQPTLDLGQYEKCVRYFGFVPEFESAKLIHSWYWRCRNQKD